MQSGMPYFWQIPGYLPQVGHGDGLPAGRVVGQGHDHQPHVFRALFQDGLLHERGVHVSLEGGDQLGVLGFLADALQRSGTGEHHMAAGGVKKQVGQGVGSWVQKVGKQDLFGRPALVYRAEKAVAEHVLTGLDKTVVALRAGVGLVAPQEPRPHLRTHGVGAGVRQGVDVDILPLQAEQVVVRLPDLVTALFSGQHFDVFHHFNAERLGNVLDHA